MSKDKIEHLKELALAREVALSYDYVPESEDVDEVHELLTEGLEIHVDLYDLQDILNKYSGWSPGEIENTAFNIINEL